MKAHRPRDSDFYGYSATGLSRYLVLYIAQAGWMLFGLFLLTHAYWPSTCTPQGLVEVYGCSFRLPEGRGWVEAGLLTWLWSTPILVVLEVMRRFSKPKRR
jgi:hypothetical protein